MRMWERAVELAEQYGTPYERARAHLEIARHLPDEASGRRYHLHEAELLFEGMGCVIELERTRAELARAGDRLRGES